MSNTVMAHISSCPDAANTIPKCANGHHCNLSCISLYVAHLEKCTRCVEHLCLMEEQYEQQQQQRGAEENTCQNVHCRKVFNCWQLKGDLNECCYRNKLKIDGYVFQGIARQLEVLLKTDFENLVYRNAPTANDARKTEEQRKRDAYCVKNTARLFDYLNIFKTFKQKMAACDMYLDGVDLVGIFQSIIASSITSSSSLSSSPFSCVQ